MSEEKKQNDSNGLSENRYESHEGRFLWMNVKALLCSLVLIALFMFGFMWFYKMVKPSRFEGDNVKVSVYMRDDKGKLEKIDDKRLEVRVESVEVKEMPADTHDYSSFLVAFVAVLATFVVLGNFAQAHNLNRAADILKGFKEYRKGMKKTIKQLENEKGELIRGVKNALINSKKELNVYVKYTLKKKMLKIAEKTINDNAEPLDIIQHTQREMSVSDGRTKSKKRKISGFQVFFKRIFCWKSNQYDVGLYYKNRNDKEKAFKWFEKAAKKGYAKAQLELGYYYMGDENVFAEWDNAFLWFRKAARLGDVNALFETGCCYWFGRGTYVDKTMAFKYWQKAAEQEDADAQCNLGYCYLSGEGVEKDMQKAVEWYTKAAKQGHAGAQNNLGVRYKKGEGVEKDAQKAVEWYRKAAEQGYAVAQFNLGNCYAKGEGVEKDMQKAVELYRKAAEQGYAGAQNNLGYYYAKGEGVEKDMQEAEKWYRKAAAQGNVDAKNNLAEIYYLGDGIKQDKKGAFEIFSEIAEEENRGESYYYLGRIYEKDSDVVKTDIEKAKECYQKAANKGYKKAEERLKELRDKTDDNPTEGQ